MALLANRIKGSAPTLGGIKLLTATFNRYLIILLLGIATYVYISSPKKLSYVFLELTGSVMSKVVSVYEGVFECINAVNAKLIYFQDLAKKNTELQLEIAKLKQSQNDIDIIKAENIALKNLLAVVEEEEFERVTAKLLTVSFSPFSKTALISAGEKHGIAVDQIVINSKGLVGRIVEVSNNYAKLMLISDVNSRIAVTSVETRERAVLAGNGVGGRMLYLPSEHLIQKGERIITSGHGNIYPAGILVGYVTEVTGKDVIVSNDADLSKTEFVQVLLQK